MKYLTRKQATAYLRENGVTSGDFLLAHLAVTGEGPQFRYWGRRPIYSEQDLDAWIESRLSPPVRSRRALEAQLSATDGEPPLGPPTRAGRRHRWHKRRAGGAAREVPLPESA